MSQFFRLTEKDRGDFRKAAEEYREINAQEANGGKLCVRLANSEQLLAWLEVQLSAEPLQLPPAAHPMC